MNQRGQKRRWITSLWNGGCVFTLAAMMTMTTGCPPMPPPQACDTDAECVIEATPFCVENVCVECGDDGDCDNGNFCDGAETCSDMNECATGTAPCTDEGQECNEASDSCDVTCVDDTDCTEAGATVCVDGTCVECGDDADCDDADLCTDDACTDGACANTDVVCDDETNCTDDSCDPATGECVSAPTECPEGQTCDADTGDCVEVTACETDEDCDDGDPCNGDETCDAENEAADDQGCVAGTDACAGTDCGDDDPICTVNDAGDAECDCPDVIAELFTLNQDTLSGSTGDDVFEGPLAFNAGSGTQIATVQTGDSANGLAGDDVLDATVNGTALVPTLTDIETQNYTCFAATALTGTNITGVDLINSKNSVATLTVTNLQETTDLCVEGVTDGASGLAATFATAVTTGTADTVGLQLKGSNAGTVAITTAANGFETITIDGGGGIANTLAMLTQTTGTTLVTANLTGDQATSLLVLPNTILTYDGSAMTGALTLGTGTSVNGGTVYATFATANLTNFSSGSGNDVINFAATLDGSDAATGTIDLNDGTDVITASFGSTVGTQLPLRDTEEVRFNATASGISVNLGGVTGLANLTIEGDGTSNTFTLLNVPGLPNLNFRGNGTLAAQTFDTVTYTTNSATGSADTLAINVNNRGTSINTAGATTNVFTIGGALTAASIETVNVTVTDGPATFAGITAAAAGSFTFTASSNLTLGTVAGGT
ncbi:MAG: hypothetical protein HOP29_01040, partial [Phycisphaerales bacterium]|nr:hypothetical protein [Phycisphaerales bacterium]